MKQGNRDHDEMIDAEELARRTRADSRGRDPRPAGALDPGAKREREPERHEPLSGGETTRGRGVEGAPVDETLARSSGTGPTSSSPGSGPEADGGPVRTPGMASTGGPIDPGR
jgi:hypothetical protein